jgi:hypothetical protein
MNSPLIVPTQVAHMCLGFRWSSQRFGEFDLDKSNVEFTGEVKWVQIDLGDAAQDFDHMITPEERYRIAMARQ